VYVRRRSSAGAGTGFEAADLEGADFGADFDADLGCIPLI
jgi:hypothetical protein